MSCRVHLIFRWFDFWIGLYKDPKRKRLYVFPVPMLRLVFDWEKE